jgi:hypothetical protein
VWIDLGFESLERAGLLRLRWSAQQLDDRIEVLARRHECIEVLARRHECRQVLAALYTPALREQLGLLWDAVHEYGAGTFSCGRFLGAYVTRPRS